MAEHIYRGECRLRRWSDSSQGGRTITLEIDADGVHPFKGYEGERFAIMVVPIGNDEKPMRKGDVAQRTEQRNSTPQVEGSNPSAPAKPNSTRAVMMAKDGEFWNYLGSIAGIKHPASSDEAEGAIKFLCGITSKKELNDRPKAAEAFERLRQDFYTYRNARQMGAA